MEQEDLDQLLKLNKENNKILRNMQRSARVGRFLKTIYWVIIFGSLYGTYYFIQPYIGQLLDLYNQATSTLNDIKQKASNIPDPSSYNLPPEILKQLDSRTKNQ